MKKTIRHLISATLCGLLLVSVDPVSFAATDDRPIWFFEETFEEVNDGAIPDLVQISGITESENSLYVTTLGGNKVLRMDANNENDLVSGESMGITIRPTGWPVLPKRGGGPVVFQWDAKIDKQAGTYQRMVFYSSANNTSEQPNANYHEFFRHNTRYFSTGKDADRGFWVNTSGSAYELLNCKLPDDPTSTTLETIALVIDMDARNAKFYFNGELICGTIPLRESLFDITSWSLSAYALTATCDTDIYLDNIKVYQSDKPLTQEEIDETDWNFANAARSSMVTDEALRMVMHDKVAFFHDSPYGYVKGERINLTNKPYKAEGTLMIPAGEALVALGGTITSQSGAKVEGTLSDKAIALTGTTKEGVLYASAEAIAKATGKQSFFDPTGLAILGDTRFRYTKWQGDEQFLRAIISSLIYDRPTGAEVVSMVKAKHPVTDRDDDAKDGHPRLLATDADFDRIASEIQTSDIKSYWFQSFKSITDSYNHSLRPVDFVNANSNIFSGSLRTLVQRNAFVYRILKDSDPEQAAQYAQIAWETLEGYCDEGLWSTNKSSNSSALMDGRCYFGVALGYDWLYDYMTEEQRSKVLESIKTKMMPTWLANYENNDNTKAFSYRWWLLGAQGDNWNPIAHRGTIMLSLAICDEDAYDNGVLTGYATRILDNAIYCLERGFNAFMPDGAYFEGPAYWQSTTEAVVDNLAALESATGSDFGFLRVPGLHETAHFLVDLTGKYCHNFGNAGEKELYVTDTSAFFYLADRYDDEFLHQVRYDGLTKAINANEPNNRVTIRDFIFCEGDPQPSKPDRETLDYYYQQSEVAGMRSSWDTDSALFASIETARGNNNSSSNDAGSFVIDAYGQRFICDLHNDNYDTVGSHNAFAYRYRAEGHNTLVINPQAGGFDTTEHYNLWYDQNPNAWSYIDRFESNDASCYAITDLSDVYNFWDATVQRGMRMVDNRKAILVQDEIALSEPGELYWFAHTQAVADIAADGKSAILTRGGEQMKVEIISDDGKFVEMAAEPLPTSPSSAYVADYSDSSHPYYSYYNSFIKLDNQLQGQYATSGREGVEDYRKLAIHLENVTETTLAVVFTPVDHLRDGYKPAIVPLADWSLDEPIMVQEVLPALSEISVNGTPIADFDPEAPLHEVTLSTKEMPVLTALNEGGTSNGVNIAYPVSLPGMATITVTDVSGNSADYGVLLNPPAEHGAVTENAHPGAKLWYVVGLYRNDGSLMEIKRVQAAATSEATISITHDVPQPAGNYYIKAMLVTAGGLQPIKEADILTIAG